MAFRAFLMSSQSAIMNKTPSVTDRPLFKPKMVGREVIMEDIIAAHIAFYEVLEKRGIKFASVEEDDRFNQSMRLFLEESFNWPDYGNYN